MLENEVSCLLADQVKIKEYGPIIWENYLAMSSKFFLVTLPWPIVEKPLHIHKEVNIRMFMAALC